MADDNNPLAPSDLPEIVKKIRARTPARLLAGRAGAAYRTNTQIDLREAHAAARDAVREEFDPTAAFGADFAKQWNLLELRTQAASKDQYLLHPDLGRAFDRASREKLRNDCPHEADLQIAIGDGLSVPAVAAQVPPLLPPLDRGAKERGWKIGRAFAIRYCRVGILNEIGELLAPKVVILLIGERPGLATVESLSAYMAYRPSASHTDANRNLISNIHARGVSPQQAAARILDLAARMMALEISGYTIREDFTASGEKNYRLPM
ncbi:MAG TPA: ethanolamine ammonia-lyase subunit EutC [Candidatus Acidoferrales bacterium]|jgi:ethanolamine ammonia-lyase small subunit|nr:ethanolamine ammonia-lyase subunit EutC [Candidatus Acidoferrales bacterium]